MKRKFIGLLVVAFAISLSSYTSRPEKGKTSFYWFPLNSFSGAPQPVTTLVYQPYDPYLCTNWAPGGYCAGAFTSYSVVGNTYIAYGSEVIIHYSLLF